MDEPWIDNLRIVVGAEGGKLLWRESVSAAALPFGIEAEESYPPLTLCEEATVRVESDHNLMEIEMGTYTWLHFWISLPQGFPTW